MFNDCVKSIEEFRTFSRRILKRTLNYLDSSRYTLNILFLVLLTYYVAAPNLEAYGFLASCNHNYDLLCLAGPVHNLVFFIVTILRFCNTLLEIYRQSTNNYIRQNLLNFSILITSVLVVLYTGYHTAVGTIQAFVPSNTLLVFILILLNSLSYLMLQLFILHVNENLTTVLRLLKVLINQRHFTFGFGRNETILLVFFLVLTCCYRHSLNYTNISFDYLLLSRKKGSSKAKIELIYLANLSVHETILMCSNFLNLLFVDATVASILFQILVVFCSVMINIMSNVNWVESSRQLSQTYNIGLKREPSLLVEVLKASFILTTCFYIPVKLACLDEVYKFWITILCMKEILLYIINLIVLKLVRWNQEELFT